ncbi:unnamed protein product [Lepeophtheirus salmonis]|uniref:(salmon louse) hypothetical protein n=1 Tax=Lepeophtheirus salmonis TaxID=72036 RepID=A0A7R8CL86_LEPSM|nr:unnamed protein product [Lepeophtheirus salmonis]CAF2853545.1 unnamed protein product [Lepeophtheirus salmonis]
MLKPQSKPNINFPKSIENKKSLRTLKAEENEKSEILSHLLETPTVPSAIRHKVKDIENVRKTLEEEKNNVNMATSVEKSRLANYSKSIGIQHSVSFFIMFYYVLILFCLHSVESQTFPSADTAKSWSLRIDEAFKKISSGDGDLTGAETFQKKFQDNIGESVIVSTDGKKKLPKLFPKKSRGFLTITSKRLKVRH